MTVIHAHKTRNNGNGGEDDEKYVGLLTFQDPNASKSGSIRYLSRHAKASELKDISYQISKWNQTFRLPPPLPPN